MFCMDEDIKITGLMFYYYWVCKRKLWYFYNQIAMEQNHENVQLGKLLDENSYMRDEKHININDVINIDFMRNFKVIHEIKKSRKIEEASIWQVKYYIYYLKKQGVYGITGKLDYPLLRQTVDVILTTEDEFIIEDTMSEIKKIFKENIPPEYHKCMICKKCAYFDLCAI